MTRPRALVPQDTDWDHFWGCPRSEKFSRLSWSKKRIIHVLKLYAVPGRKVLDAGCGSGFFSNFFCEKGMQTVSLDYSDEALKMSRKITAGRARTVKADLVTDDLGALMNEKFHVIFSDGLFEHFPKSDQNKIMANFLAVLDDDGVIVTFVPNRWSPWELIRPFFMPGIKETPFVLKELVDLNQRNRLRVVADGGVNTLPFKYSPDKLLSRRFGMLLYAVSQKSKSFCSESNFSK